MTGLCLIVDLDLAFDAGGAVRPLGMRLLGGLARLARTLDITLMPVRRKTGAGHPNRLVELTGQDWTPIVLEDGQPADAGLCKGNEPILLTGPGGIAAAPRVRRWVMGDAAMGTGSAEDILRLVQEALRVPVPRPVAPAHRKGALVALPRIERDTLLRLAYADASADWIRLGDWWVVYTENTDREDCLRVMPGARLVSRSESLSRLYIAPTSDVPALIASDGRALMAANATPGEGAQRWAVLSAMAA